LTSTTNSAADAATENFADLLAESFGEGTNVEGSVVRGFVIGIEGDAVIIDVGLKSEGRVPLKELAAPGQQADVSIGDEIEVYVERMEDRNGQAVLSRDKARREEAWGVLEASFEKQERVKHHLKSKSALPALSLARSKVVSLSICQAQRPFCREVRSIFALFAILAH